MIDVLIIGSGPAGYTAGIYATRAGYNVTLVTGTQFGGQLTIASSVENYSGFVEPIEGAVLMDNMRQQAEKMGVNIVFDTIEAVDFSKRPFICRGESTYESRSVIIATGASARWLGLANEEKYRGRGVSACATCDGFFFKNKVVCVIGGGNTAVSEASYLTNFAKKVYLIHRKNSFHAEKIVEDRALANPNIEILFNTKVVDILGDDTKVTGLQISDIDGNNERTLEMDGVFIAIGHSPASELFRGQIDIADNGYIIANPDTRETSVPGVFACGDVCNPYCRQAIVAAGQGCVAAMNLDKYLG